MQNKNISLIEKAESIGVRVLAIGSLSRVLQDQLHSTFSEEIPPEKKDAIIDDVICLLQQAAGNCEEIAEVAETMGVSCRAA